MKGVAWTNMHMGGGATLLHHSTVPLAEVDFNILGAWIMIMRESRLESHWKIKAKWRYAWCILAICKNNPTSLPRPITNVWRDMNSSPPQYARSFQKLFEDRRRDWYGQEKRIKFHNMRIKKTPIKNNKTKKTIKKKPLYTYSTSTDRETPNDDDDGWKWRESKILKRVWQELELRHKGCLQLSGV